VDKETMKNLLAYRRKPAKTRLNSANAKGEIMVRSQIRSKPEERHLKEDGSSGSLLIERLQKEVSTANRAQSSFFLSRLRRKRRRNRASTFPKGSRLQIIEAGEAPEIHHLENFEITTNQIEGDLSSEGKLSLDTAQSSGRKLQTILEKIVDDNETRDPENDQLPSQSQNHNHCKEASTQEIHDFQSRYGNNVETEQQITRTCRYEMSESKLYLRQRKNRKGQKTVRKQRDYSTHTKDPPIIRRNVDISPDSTISLSSCSIDSVLDDPIRMRNYEQLKKFPPPPPPPRLQEPSTKERNFFKIWYDRQIDMTDLKNVVGDALGKANKIFGCSSG